MSNSTFIKKLTELLENNFTDENFGPEQLAEKMGMSHSGLHRKLKEISGQNTSQFIREIRLQKAKEILVNEEFTISEIAYKVGFGSATYFNKCFHDYFGVAPGEFKKQENEKLSEIQKPKKKIKNVLLFYVAPVLILMLVFLFLNEKYSILRKEAPIKKSIALLPVNYLGDPEYKYRAEGTWEEIKNNLAKINDLRVLDRASVEQYRFSTKSEKEIGKELNVGALLKITFQRENKEIILFVNLLNSKDGSILFSEKYRSTEVGIFALQSEIPQTIANKLHTKITPEEKLRIEKVPTISLTANDFYRQGKNEYQKYEQDNENKEALEKAEKHFYSALNYDSNFALAYVGLAQIYFEKNYWKEFFQEVFLDSVLILADKALSYDNQLADGYYMKARYFHIRGNFTQAIEEYNKSLELNSNLWEAYLNKGKLYLFNGEEMDRAIFNLYQAAQLHRGYALGHIYQNLGEAFNWIGLFNQRDKFFAEAFTLTEDSLLFYAIKAASERINKNYKKEAEWLKKAYHYNTKNIFNLKQLAFALTKSEQYQESLKYYKILWKIYDALDFPHSKVSLNDIHRIGYAFWKNGLNDDANIYFDLQKQYCEKEIELYRIETEQKYIYYDLAAVYVFKGEKENALKNLRIFNERKTMPFWAIELIKIDPLFDKIRNEPEFQQIVKEVETKYETEHDRIKKWLEEQGLI